MKLYHTAENKWYRYTHTYLFWLHRILNPFKFRLTNFATSEVTAFQISPLFWKAVSISESNE